MTKKLILALLSFVLAGLAAEGLVRILSTQSTSHYLPDRDLIYRLDASREWLFIHHADDGGATISNSSNTDGFRGPEIDSPRSRPRLMIYGDSFIEAEFSNWNDSLAGRLGGELERLAGNSWEVVNGGVSGWGPDQLARKLEADLRVYEPDAVVIAIYPGNDYGDLVRNRLLTTAGDWSNGTIEEETWESMERSSRPRGVRRLHVMRLLEAKLGLEPEGPRVEGDYILQSLRWADEAHDAFTAPGPVEIFDRFMDHYDADLAIDPEAESSQLKQRLMGHALDHLAKLLSDAEIPHLFVVLPVAFDQPGFHYQIDSSAHPGYQAGRLAEITESLLHERSLPTLSLRSIFAEGGGGDLFLRGEGQDHWNDDGQALAASAIARSLHPLIDLGGALDEADRLEAMEIGEALVDP